MKHHSMSRRDFLAMGRQQQDSLSGRGETGTLRDPYSVGRSRERATEADNDETVKGIEKRLRCSCGCNLDIFTCRTTDFTCTVSPQLHREVMGLYESGVTPEQIVQRFVDEYGEQALMAPKPEGFNLAGYLVPGTAILLVGSLLGIYLMRRRQVMSAEGTAVQPAAPGQTAATPEELERLRRALAEDSDL